MATVKGQNLRLFLNNKVVAMATTCSMQLQAVVREVSHKDIEGGWVEQMVVKLNWTVTSDCVVCDEAAHGVTVAELEQMVGQMLQVDFARAGGEHNADKGSMLFSGYAVLNDLTITAQNRQNSTCTISMTGQGRLGQPLFLADKNSLIFRTSDGYLLTV